MRVRGHRQQAQTIVKPIEKIISGFCVYTRIRKGYEQKRQMMIVKVERQRPQIFYRSSSGTRFKQLKHHWSWTGGFQVISADPAHLIKGEDGFSSDYNLGGMTIPKQLATVIAPLMRI